MMSRIYFGIYALFGFISLAQCCDHPPSLWCSSENIARQCQVEEQCRKWKFYAGRVEPVQFTLYFESLCPDCKQFVTNQLYPTWMEIGEIMNLTLIPYGNAEERKAGNNWVFDCQHGKLECYGNIVETCAIYLLKNIKVYFPLIHCIEQSQSTDIETVIKQCASTHHVDYNSLLKCANSSIGNHLEHEMALKTDALNPPHTFVPWVTLNGVHTDEIQKKAETNLLELICDSYKGPKPNACTKHIYKKCLRPQK
ncbi:gamma-interferon-inducible lysosomal thiol reductase-like [Tubulanus polymorphus]|uniref:gamma-interferon-inducible lysosomal thiol reductase-like n=1 Tax=Tubulanus polymorphus TaxID=672921 RepID=UPI003DA36173